MTWCFGEPEPYERASFLVRLRLRWYRVRDRKAARESRRRAAQRLAERMGLTAE